MHLSGIVQRIEERGPRWYVYTFSVKDMSNGMAIYVSVFVH
jgi:hypothetical protein